MLLNSDAAVLVGGGLKVLLRATSARPHGEPAAGLLKALSVHNAADRTVFVERPRAIAIARLRAARRQTFAAAGHAHSGILFGAARMNLDAVRFASLGVVGSSHDIRGDRVAWTDALTELPPLGLFARVAWCKTEPIVRRQVFVDGVNDHDSSSLISQRLGPDFSRFVRADPREDLAPWMTSPHLIDLNG